MNLLMYEHIHTQVHTREEQSLTAGPNPVTPCLCHRQSHFHNVIRNKHLEVSLSTQPLTGDIRLEETNISSWPQRQYSNGDLQRSGCQEKARCLAPPITEETVNKEMSWFTWLRTNKETTKVWEINEGQTDGDGYWKLNRGGDWGTKIERSLTLWS